MGALGNLDTSELSRKMSQSFGWMKAQEPGEVRRTKMQTIKQWPVPTRILMSRVLW